MKYDEKSIVKILTKKKKIDIEVQRDLVDGALSGPGVACLAK